MLHVKSGLTLPGWRDFERSVAAAFGGRATESKAVFDVVFTSETTPGITYGLSCKMRRELNRIQRDGRVTIELSNSAGQFWDRLAAQGINPTNYRANSAQVGAILVALVREWHVAVGTEAGGIFDLSKSSYLVLSWNKAGSYQLHQFSLELPDPAELKWSFPAARGQGGLGRRLKGDDNSGTLFEWYGESGGQLKYYPLASNATWQSEPFRLEPLPNREYGLRAKAAAYFPGRWRGAS
jgi:hypothetical protein